MIEYFLMAFVAAGSGPGGAPAAAPKAEPAVVAQVPEAQVPAAEPEKEPTPVAPREFKNPVNITADRFEIQGKRLEATWIGKVKAIRGRTVLSCDRLVAHYTRAQEITRIECIGNVESTHGDMWVKGERADFDNVAGILVVTGSPQAKKGPNLMRGSKIIFDVARDTVQVEKAETIFDSLGTRPGRPGAGR